MLIDAKLLTKLLTTFAGEHVKNAFLLKSRVGEDHLNADLVLVQLLVKIAYARVEKSEQVEVMEIDLDDIPSSKRSLDKICDPTWFIKGSTPDLVFHLLRETKLSPRIEYAYDGGYGDRLATGFKIVIPTPPTKS